MGLIEPDVEALHASLRDLMDELADDNWEIKSVVPLTACFFQTEILVNAETGLRGRMREQMGFNTEAVGGGLAFAAPFTVGVLVLAQRPRDATDAELAASRQARADRAAEAERAASRAAEAERIRKEDIDEVSAGLFSAKFRFRGVTYKTIEEARAAREKLAADVLAGTVEPGAT
jgi:hypothetical protein